MFRRVMRALEAGRAAVAEAENAPHGATLPEQDRRGRIGRALDAGRAAVADAEAAARNTERPAVALVVLDTMGPDAEAMRRAHQRFAAGRGLRPLFVLGPLSELEHPERHLLCEFLPLPEELGLILGERDEVIRAYLAARLRAILDKWRVEECFWAGERAAELIESWPRDAAPTGREIRFAPASIRANSAVIG